MSMATTTQSRDDAESNPVAPRLDGLLSGRRLSQLGIPVLAASLFLAGLIVAGRLARDGLRQQERYTIAFADIECPPAPGQERGDFLGEVQYLAGLPDRLSLLEDDLAERLHQAFGRHPWTEKVTRVEVNLPGQVQVELVYRTPVLAVPLPPSRGAGVATTLLVGRMVDREGVLLPVRAAAPGVPTLLHHDGLKMPAGPAGTHWGDGTVESAARIAGVLQGHEHSLRVTAVQLRGDDWVLTTARGNRILWGRPPGRELPEEATARQKVELLLDYCRRHGGLGSPEGPYEHDVRVPKSLSSRRLLFNAGP
jgi:hypothetical protein